MTTRAKHGSPSSVIANPLVIKPERAKILSGILTHKNMHDPHILFLDLDSYDFDMEKKARLMVAQGNHQVVLFGDITDSCSKKELKQHVLDEIREHLHPSLKTENTFDNWANILTWLATHLCMDYTILTNNPVGFSDAPHYIEERILSPLH